MQNEYEAYHRTFDVIYRLIVFFRITGTGKTNLGGYLVPMCVYNGDTIPAFQIPTIHIFKPLKFRNRKEQMEYYKLVRNVKKVYPIAREINRTIIETYEYLQTLPNEKPANVISNGWKKD